MPASYQYLSEWHNRCFCPILGSHLRFSPHIKRLGDEKIILIQKLSLDTFSRRESSKLLRQCTLVITRALLEVENGLDDALFRACSRLSGLAFSSGTPSSPVLVHCRLARHSQLSSAHRAFSIPTILDLEAAAFPACPLDWTRVSGPPTCHDMVYSGGGHVASRETRSCLSKRMLAWTTI